MAQDNNHESVVNLSLKNSRVLIVDDSKGVIAVLEQYLTALVKEVHKSYDGNEALNIIAKNQIDFVFLDLNMPGIDGFEVLKRITEQYPSIATIIMTGNKDRQTTVEALRLHAFGFIEKPFKADDIVKVLQDAMKYRLSKSAQDVSSVLQNDVVKDVYAVVVCDNNEEMEIYKKVFSSLGSQIDFFADMEQAKKQMLKASPDIVLLNLSTYKTNIDLLKTIRAESATQFAYVFLISDIKESLTINEAFKHGVDDFVQKPIKPIQFKIKLKTQFDRISKQKKKYDSFTEQFSKIKKQLEEKDRMITHSSKMLEDLEKNLHQTATERDELKKIAGTLNEDNNEELKSILEIKEIELNEASQSVDALKTEYSKINFEKKKIYDEKEKLKEQYAQIKEETQKMKDDYERSINDKKKLEDDLKGLKDRAVGNNTNNGDLQEEIRKKEEKITKLSEIIAERSKIHEAKAKDKRAMLSQSQQEEVNIKKIKTDGKKEVLDQQKTEIEQTYSQVEEVISKAISEVMTLLIGMESSLTTKDNIMDNSLRSIYQLYDSTAKELYKYKELYFKAGEGKENAAEAIKLTQEAQTQSLEKVKNSIQAELRGVNSTINEKQEEVKTGLDKIDNMIKSQLEKLNEKRKECEKTEKEWLFMLQDHYKEKYFELLDEFNSKKLEIEEKEIIIDNLQEKNKMLEGKNLFYKERHKMTK